RQTYGRPRALRISLLSRGRPGLSVKAQRHRRGGGWQGPSSGLSCPKSLRHSPPKPVTTLIFAELRADHDAFVAAQIQAVLYFLALPVPNRREHIVRARSCDIRPHG